MKALRASVRGRVQGVGFRAFTAREGRRRGLTGWVRNEPDGSVTVLAEGPTDAVEQFLQWLKQGPPSAHVAGVDVEWIAATGNLASFDIR